MAETPRESYEYNAAQIRAALQRQLDLIEEGMAQARAAGDEVQTAFLQAKAEQVRTKLVNPAIVAEGNAELEKQVAITNQLAEATKASTAADAERLAIIREQVDALGAAASIGGASRLAPRAPAGMGAPAFVPVAVAKPDPAPWELLIQANEKMEAAERRRIADLERQNVLVREQAAAYERLSQSWIQTHRGVQMGAHQAGLVAGTTAAEGAGRGAALEGSLLTEAQLRALSKGPPMIAQAGGANPLAWGQEEQALVRERALLTQHQTLLREAGTSTSALTANVTRLGMAHNEASNALRRHGALTTEFIQALARGETTVSEFGYQLGATVGKVAGWTAATGVLFAGLGAVADIGKGGIDAASGVQQLTRTLGDFDQVKAGLDLTDLSEKVNVPIKEAADAVFAFSRTFHNLNDATTAARGGLTAYKLDQVDLNDSVKMQTALHQQFGLSAQQISGNGGVYDMLAAGQREYNARLTQMVPLIQNASGAVAAGSQTDPQALQTLIQLGVYAQLVTQRTGSVVGTAFQRSAATFLSPATTKGQADLAKVAGMGIDVSSGNWTTIMLNALQRAPKLTEAQRKELPLDIFGPQLGARMAAIFDPKTSQQTFEQGIRQNITPQATWGKMQKELDEQLGTLGERLKSFSNELQRIGATIATSGGLNLLGHALDGVVGTLGVFRHGLDLFAGLPSAAKTAIEALLTFGGALLFFNKTRFGSSIADLGFGERDPATGLRRYRLSALPGVGASDSQRDRLALMSGTRAATEAVNADLQRINASLLTNGARQLSLGEQNAAIDAEILSGSGDRAKLIEQSARIDAKIVALKADQEVLEAERNTVLEAQRGLATQQTRLKSGDYSAAEMATMAATPGTAAPAARTVEEAQQRVTAAEMAIEANEIKQAEIKKARAALAAEAAKSAGYQNELEERSAVAEAQQVRLERRQAELIMQRNAALLEQADLTLVANTEQVGILARTRAGAAAVGASVAGVAGGFASFIAGLDPMLVAMIALPAIMDNLNGVLHKVDQAAQDAGNAMNAPADTLQAAQAKIDQLGKAAQEKLTPKVAGGLGWLVQHAAVGVGDVVGGSAGRGIAKWAMGVDPAGAQRLEDQQQAWMGVTEDAALKLRRFQAAAKQYGGSLAGQGMLGATEIADLAANNIKGLFSGVDTKLLTGFEKGFHDALSQVRQSTLPDLASHVHGIDAQLAAFNKLTNDQLTAQLQGLSDRSELYGLSPNDVSGALGTALVMAARFRDSTDPKQLQALKTGTTQALNIFTKSAKDFADAAKGAATPGDAISDYNQSESMVNSARSLFTQWLDAERRVWAKVPGLMQKDMVYAKQFLDSLAKISADNISGIAQSMEQQTELQVSQMPGITPEADLARLTAGLTGYRAQAQMYRAHGVTPPTALLQRIGDTSRQVQQSQQSIDQGRITAQAEYNASTIMGSTPADDVARARATLVGLQQTLAYDQSHGADQAKIWQDQKAVNGQIKTINDGLRTMDQQTASEAKDLRDSLAQLAADQAVGDPVAGANALLQAAEADLAALKPSQFPDMKQYEAAMAKQRDEVLKRQQALTDAYAKAAQQQTQSIDALATLQESQTDDPVAQARIAHQAAVRDLATIQPRNYQTHREYVDAHRQGQAKVNQTALAQAQAAREQRQQLIASNEAYAESLTNDPVKQAADKVQADREELATVRPQDYKSRTMYLKDLRDKQTQLNNDLKAYADAISSAADEMRGVLSAQASYEASLTTDPVQKATIQLTTDRQLLATLVPSQFKTYAEYLKAYYDAMAAVNNDITNLNDAIVTQDMSTLDFELHTQRISNEQYINGLEQLLRMKNLSLQQRQDLMSKLYDAQHSGEVSLNLGNIKMPTSYEVARVIRNAVQGPVTAARDALASVRAGGDGASIGDYTGLRAAVPGATVTNTNSIVINVDRNTDMAAFAQALEEAVSGNFAAIRTAHP